MPALWLGLTLPAAPIALVVALVALLLAAAVSRALDAVCLALRRWRDG